MPRYTVRAFEADGRFAFGATLECVDREAAIARFGGLPLGGRRAQLFHADRLVATLDAVALPRRSTAR